MVPEIGKDGKRHYGVWAGDPQGNSEVPAHCVAAVHDAFTHRFHQCSRKRGHGRDGLFCRQHAKKERNQ
jgi:hypothetical protein